MRRKLLTILFVLALLAISPMTAFADHGEGTLPAPYCGELEAADCDIVTEAQHAALDVESFTSDAQMNLHLEGFPGQPAEQMDFSLTSTSRYAMDPAVMAKMMEIQSMDPADMMSNVQDMMDVVLSFYSAASLDANMNVTLPQEVADLIAAQTPGVTIPTDITAHIIMKDGFAYTNLADYEDFYPGISANITWIGIDLAGLIKMGLEQSMQDPQAMQASVMGFQAGSIANSDQVHDLLNPYVVVERGDDDAVSGTDVAVFDTTFDINSFLASQEFLDLIVANLDMINASAQMEITKDQVDQAAGFLPLVGPLLFGGLDFGTSNAVGIDDNFLYGTAGRFNWDLSSIAQLAALAPEGTNLPIDPDMKPLLEYNWETTGSDFNSADEVQAPEDAVIIPLEALAP